jgi:hypothetical protein
MTAILGLPIDPEDERDFEGITPLAATVIVKALNPAGEVCYIAAATEGLMTVECLGMVNYARVILEEAIRPASGEPN